MKLIISMCCIFAVSIHLWHPTVPLAQEVSKENTTQKDVLSLAEKTLDAIRSKDVALLSAIIDPTGVYIGVDSPKISTVRFRKELAEKRGVYCVIFDISCTRGDFQNSPTASSLRELLISQPVSVLTSTAGHPKDIAVAVKKACSPNEVLFTLMFRHVGGNWKLQQIEYE